MPITPGSHIGPYEVTGQLGEGGMGVVYRGRDSRLQRDVALKVLPDNFASDPDRLSRFQREAQVLASLNHSHIAQIYGLEQFEGSSCIVMELVEGETLADRVKRGALAYDEAIDIARQIADALSTAHERGIVHRDLKPANIKITPNGTVKVLDFGLAKALGPQTSSAGVTAMPTVATGSIVGSVVGTPGYMSPEQARGKEVDARTDIWAFGCVLYEMLTAKQAFDGETVTDIMAKIVTSPPDLELLPRDTPGSVRLLLSSVLNKNSSQRLQHIGDTRLFLDGALVPGEASKSGGSTKRSMPTKFAVAAAAGGIALAVLFAVLYFRATPQPAAPMRFELAFPGGGSPILSPNGLTIGYVNAGADGKRMLWLRPIGSETAQQVSGTDGVSAFMWSPDSEKIAFVADGKLKKVNVVTGGSPQILGNATATVGASWNGAGVILMGRSKDNIIASIPDSGGEVTPLTKLDQSRGESIHALPVFLPDNKHFLYVAAGAKPEEAGIFLAALDAPQKAERVLAVMPNRFNNMAYVEPGILVYSNEGRVIAQRLKKDGRTFVGEPVTIAEELDGTFSVSNNGVMLYHKVAPAAARQLLWFSHDGKPLGQLGATGNYVNLDLSPKGDRAAVDMWTDNNRDIWIVDVERAVPQRITFDTGADWSAVWSPDGSRIMFATSRAGNNNITRIMEKSSTGAGNETIVDVGDASSIPLHWSTDNNYLIYARLRANGNGYDPWILPLTGERKPSPFLESTFDRIQTRISPDSHYLAYTTNESGVFQIVVQTFPDPNGGKWQITAEGGVEPKWRRDGKELYYLALDGKLMAVPIGGPAFSAGKPTMLFQTPLTVGKTNPTRDRRYDIAPDGRFLMVVPSGTGPVYPHTAVVNWDSALR